MNTPLHIIPEDLRGNAGDLGKLSEDVRRIQDSLIRAWGRLDAGWEDYAETGIQEGYNKAMGELGHMIAMLVEMEQALLQATDKVESADKLAAALFSAESIAGKQPPGSAGPPGPGSEKIWPFSTTSMLDPFALQPTFDGYDPSITYTSVIGQTVSSGVVIPLDGNPTPAEKSFFDQLLEAALIQLYTTNLLPELPLGQGPKITLLGVGQSIEELRMAYDFARQGDWQNAFWSTYRGQLEFLGMKEQAIGFLQEGMSLIDDTKIVFSNAPLEERLWPCIRVGTFSVSVAALFTGAVGIRPALPGGILEANLAAGGHTEALAFVKELTTLAGGRPTYDPYHYGFLGQISPGQVKALNAIAHDESASLTVTGRTGASPELAEARIQASSEFNRLVGAGVPKEDAYAAVLEKFNLQYPGQVRASSGYPEVDVLIRPSGIDPADFQAASLSPQGEAALKDLMGVPEIDYYNRYTGPGYDQYVDWTKVNPYGVTFTPEGSVIPEWGRPYWNFSPDPLSTATQAGFLKIMFDLLYGSPSQ